MVLASGGWKRDCPGTVVDGPELVDTLQGPDNYWWVEFDEPEADINGGPWTYRKAQVLSCYVRLAD